MMGMDSTPWVVPEGARKYNKRAARGGPKTIRKEGGSEDNRGSDQRSSEEGRRGREERGDPEVLAVGVEDIKRMEEEEDWEGKASPTRGPE